ncbi:gamma carbonic anhydrase family protein [Pelotomaculum propionicicum]|uniref:2,3,4,5-tetrahydropyridine-2,6-dicarboxylate N-acetyltransferase n=1 Tax=Pelotomaculum propionicicum TaxID=258475 RepID=A0A4Y7RTL4_9FIRM|nr:gamma carbonic anhydrase family protein [Pelotomaculum propionicicum]TEB12344.1 2,3,4,5-tetrahydropyridine-2,6-dicarboxylate N-acetyltransferase [Pelotomaculum propionicicum]
MIYLYEGVEPVIDQTAFIAPGAVVIGKVRVGPQASIWYNTVVRGDYDQVSIGACTSIQDGSILHEHAGFPLFVGERVTVGHRVVLHGCTIEDDAYIGMGSIILNGARIGAGAVIGAGSLVLQGQDIPPGMLAMGAPAKVVRAIKEEELPRFRGAVGRYLNLAEKHRGIVRLS